MQVRASARGVRMSARKAQLVVQLIRGRPAAEALAILQFDPHAAARVVWKVVRSAVANAENNYALDAGDLFVVSATADQGPSLPRKYRAKARGQAAIIASKSTHITVVVDDEPGRLLRLRRQQQTRAAARPAGSRAPRRPQRPAPAAQAAPAAAGALSPPAAPVEASEPALAPAGTEAAVPIEPTAPAEAPPTPAAPEGNEGAAQ